jgi:hypothetical protein
VGAAQAQACRHRGRSAPPGRDAARGQLTLPAVEVADPGQQDSGGLVPAIEVPDAAIVTSLDNAVASPSAQATARICDRARAPICAFARHSPTSSSVSGRATS